MSKKLKNKTTLTYKEKKEILTKLENKTHTQSELARLYCVDQSTISRFYTNRFKIYNADIIIDDKKI